MRLQEAEERGVGAAERQIERAGIADHRVLRALELHRDAEHLGDRARLSAVAEDDAPRLKGALSSRAAR